MLISRKKKKKKTFTLKKSIKNFKKKRSKFIKNIKAFLYIQY